MNYCGVCETNTNHEIYVFWLPNKKKFSSKEKWRCLMCDNLKK